MDKTDISIWLPIFKVSAESDKELQRYFHKTKFLSSILESDKWILLGRKGTGKTAIFEYLKTAPETETNGYHTISLNFKDYPWPIHKLYKDSMEGELTAYQNSWRYLFSIQALTKLIFLRESKKEKLSNDLKIAKKIIYSIYNNPQPTLIDVIKSKIFRLDNLSLPGVEAGEVNISLGEISFEEVSDDAKLKSKLKSNAFTLSQYFESVLTKNIGKEKILITLDQLDENWIASEIEEYSKILINLINAAKYTNYNTRVHNNIKVVPFLRTDIYDSLNFNDKNKVYQDNAVEIRWDLDSLDDMFFQRILKYKPDDLEINVKSKSNSAFDVKFVRHGAPPIKHIVRRSFMRPRDIIVYFNKINEIHKPSKSGLFTSKELYEAEKDYSNSMYDEIMDEWINQKPEIKDILSILQIIGYQTFKYKTYEAKYLSTIGDSNSSDAKESLRFLFRNSIIGQKIKVHWEYFCGNPHMTIDFDKEFYVNAALKKRLNITEGKA